METVKHFLANYKRFYSGELDHEEISSMAIKKIMFTLNYWRIPIRGKDEIVRVSIGFLLYIVSLYYCFSGYPRVAEIPEWGKFLDILAGVQLSFAKMIFLYWKRHELTDLISSVNQLSQNLKARALKDPQIKRLRDSFYFQEMVFYVFTATFTLVFQLLIFIQVLTTKPYQLVVPMSVNWKEIVTGPSTTYWIIFSTECFLCPTVALFIPLCELMLGNLYSQLILHLEVLHHDIRLLDRQQNVTSVELYKKYCEFSRTYRSISKMNAALGKCMRPFFVYNLFSASFATIFSCVEVGIMMNVDPKQCLKPFLYFLFINFTFFYWCWLGNRVSEKSSALAQTAFIYKERTTDVINMKIQLLFAHMVQEPLPISAPPFFVLDFDIFVTVMKMAYQFTAVFKSFHK